MQLQTPVYNDPSAVKLKPESYGVVVGSCFAEKIADRLLNLRFNLLANPNGVIYNPLSILQTLESLKHNRQYTAADLIKYNGLYHSFNHHGRFSSTSEQEILQKINSISLSHQPNYLIITLGTAWTYKIDGLTVANCHKLPDTRFTRHRLSFAEISDALTQIAELFPSAHKIFTVSPIRHIKDGLTENSLSKSLLRGAVGELIENRDDCSYFPAFEIMMDELRDYRFYGEDMTHPTQQATKYIISRFEKTYFDDQTTNYAAQITKLLTAAAHRPLHPDTEAYEKFKNSCIEQLEALSAQYPNVKFSDLFSTFA